MTETRFQKQNPHVSGRNALFRGLLAGLWLLLVLGTAPALAQGQNRGQTQSLFEVRGVEVDVTAANATEAREQAMAEGEQLAFRRLLERLTLRTDYSRLPTPGADQVAATVKDFSVAEEKASDVRYLARLNFRFKENDIRRILMGYSLPFAETFSKPVLVLPVYEQTGALILWDDPNPWREAWTRISSGDRLVPLTLPRGDLADIAAIGSEQAVDGDAPRLAAIAKRYGAGDALVAHAILRKDVLGLQPELEVYITRHGSALQEQTLVKTFLAEEGESIPLLLARAASALALEVEDNWKKDNLLQFGSPGVVASVVRVGGLGDWIAVRDRLNRVAVIRQMDLVLMSRDEVRVNLHYIGDPEQLALALQQADLTLERVGDEWILALSR